MRVRKRYPLTFEHLLQARKLVPRSREGKLTLPFIYCSTQESVPTPGIGSTIELTLMMGVKVI